MNLAPLQQRLRILRSQIAHKILRLSGEGVARGDRRYRAGDWPRAFRAYRTHLISYPNDAETWVKLAECAFSMGDLPDGYYGLRQALSLQPNEPSILTRAAQYYLQRGYVLSAHACLARARRLDATIAAEITGPTRASLKPIPDGHRLLLDLTDMFAFFRQSVRKTGMQRLQAGVLTSIIERDIGGDIAITFFDDSLSEYRVASTLLACELVDASNAEATTVHDLQVIMNQMFGAAEPLRSRPGDFYLVLGAFWFDRGYLPRLNGLRRNGASVGIYFHDLIPYTHPEYVDVATQQHFTGKLQEALSSIDFACTNSMFVAGELKAFIAEKALNIPVGPVPLGHELPDADGTPVPEAFIHSVPPEFVLCVGTIEKRKNHVLLLEVWKRLRAKHGDKIPTLVIVGKWGWRIEEFREKLADAKNVGGKVVVREGLADNELQYLYRHCLFTAFPSLVEGWGLPVGESLNLGKPCIASNSSSIPEVGGDLVRYFDPKNVDEAYAVIEAAILDRADLAAWGESIRTTFKPRSWDDVTDDLIATSFELSALARSRSQGHV